MRKAMTSALVVTFALVLSFVLVTGSPAQAGQYGDYHHRPTILDELVGTDGAQALVAAVLVVDGSETECPQIGELLDDRKAKLTLLAPNNTGFEDFLGLPEGDLDGLSIGNIVEKLVGLELDPNNVCSVLLNHVSVKGAQSTRALLKRGQINVVGSESDYPVAIGGPAGVWINYENAITEADVVAANGVIQYLDSVIAEVPFTPPTTPPPDKDNVCQRDFCAADSDLEEECETFLVACLAEESANEEECIGGALLICSEI